MATQTSYIAALNTLLNLKATGKSDYWTGLINAAMDKPLKSGSVQATLTNPLAYFIVPLAGDGKKGRGHSYATAQYVYALKKGWTVGTAEKLRALKGLTQEEIDDLLKEGMMYSEARKDSSLGTKEDRRNASKTAHENLIAREQVVADQLAAKAAKRAEQKAAAAASKAADKQAAGDTE